MSQTTISWDKTLNTFLQIRMIYIRMFSSENHRHVYSRPVTRQQLFQSPNTAEYKTHPQLRNEKSSKSWIEAMASNRHRYSGCFDKELPPLCSLFKPIAEHPGAWRVVIATVKSWSSQINHSETGAKLWWVLFVPMWRAGGSGATRRLNESLRWMNEWMNEVFLCGALGFLGIWLEISQPHQPTKTQSW